MKIYFSRMPWVLGAPFFLSVGYLLLREGRMLLGGIELFAGLVCAAVAIIKPRLMEFQSEGLVLAGRIYRWEHMKRLSFGKFGGSLMLQFFASDSNWSPGQAKRSMRRLFHGLFSWLASDAVMVPMTGVQPDSQTILRTLLRFGTRDAANKLVPAAQRRIQAQIEWLQKRPGSKGSPFRWLPRLLRTIAAAGLFFALFMGGMYFLIARPDLARRYPWLVQVTMVISVIVGLWFASKLGLDKEERPVVAPSRARGPKTLRIRRKKRGGSANTGRISGHSRATRA